MFMFQVFSKSHMIFLTMAHLRLTKPVRT